MKTTLQFILFSLLAILPFAATNADTTHGMQLHEENCIACHAARFGNDGTEIYTRHNHRVKNMEALNKQVNRCKDNLGLTWFDEDVNDVTDYLNKTFYQFK